MVVQAITQPLKANFVLRLKDDDGRELHATKLQLSRAKLSTPLRDVIERFARHRNRRCAPEEKLDAAALEARDGTDAASNIDAVP